jgi:transposase
MATTRQTECSAADAPLYVAFELSAGEWKLACAPGGGVAPRLRTLRGEARLELPRELAQARRHFGLLVTAPVVSCYEAGRDGFWIHRYLTGLGVRNVVVDAASIEVTRRARQVKTDRLDAVRLLDLLVRAEAGRAAWRVVRVPPEAAEDARQVIRERRTVRADRTRVRNRLRGLLATQGVRLALRADFVTRLAAARRWDGTPLGPGLQHRLTREWETLQAIEARLAVVEPRPATRTQPAPPAVAALQHLCGIGEAGAWTLGVEVLSWRTFHNRREAGSFLGLTPTPYASGTQRREQGISKVGPPALRALLIQLAWQWRRFQPRSVLAQWYEARFGGGGPRARRIGIVALARKLWIALWRYVTQGVIPDGAVLKAAA